MKHDESTKEKAPRGAALATLGDSELMAVVEGRPGGGSKSGGSKPTEHLTFTYGALEYSYVL